MLLCNNQNECDYAATDSLTEGLRAGQLCIYASVFNGDKSHLSRISSKIINYQENIERGNLVIMIFFPSMNLPRHQILHLLNSSR